MTKADLIAKVSQAVEMTRKGTVKLTERRRDSPQNDRSPQSLSRRTSPLSNRKKPGPEGVGDERLKMMTTDSEQVLNGTVN